MTVYVDDMDAEYRGMRMFHMIADTDEELHDMAGRIGVARWHFQKAGTPQRHYDICLSKRKLAVIAGAIEITWRQTGAMTRRRRFTNELGSPAEAEQWQADRVSDRRAQQMRARRAAATHTDNNVML